KADFQDLVLLISLEQSNPQSSTGGSSSSSSTSYSSTSTTGGSGTCGSSQKDVFYRVGVQVFESYKPYFMPQDVFGRENRAVSDYAVAEVKPSYQYKTSQSIQPVQCGVFADQSFVIRGNNLNSSSTNYCTNGDVYAGLSVNGTMGDILARSGKVLNKPGGSSGNTIRFSERKPVPRFKQSSPTYYDVNLGNFSSWSDLNACRGLARAMRTKGSSQADVRWENGGAVCVTYTNGQFTITGNNKGKIQLSNGDAVSIYSDEKVSFGSNGIGLKGGLYWEGDIEILMNNHEFIGDVDVLGGLALWSERDITFSKNNLTVRGILGSRGDITQLSKGGGTPVFEGLITSGGTFKWLANSNNSKITHVTSNYDRELLTNLEKWGPSKNVQNKVKTPDFSQVQTYLID
ncbi:MAG: hypothetical protein ABEK50_18290, partial [bacterium]